jgi:hypothetical protein
MRAHQRPGDFAEPGAVAKAIGILDKQHEIDIRVRSILSTGVRTN